MRAFSSAHAIFGIVSIADADIYVLVLEVAFADCDELPERVDGRGIRLGIRDIFISALADPKTASQPYLE
jgi:hypothetical protein